MAYNKAREERKWRIWKDAEEKQLRSLGVSEDKIEQLREHDWSIFKAERRYYEKLQDAGTYIETVAENISQSEIKTVEELLDSIEDVALHQILLSVDKLSLEAVLLKLQGFSVQEISQILGLKEQTVYKRLNRLKEKIKKLLG